MCRWRISGSRTCRPFGGCVEGRVVAGYGGPGVEGGSCGVLQGGDDGGVAGYAFEAGDRVDVIDPVVGHLALDWPVGVAGGFEMRQCYWSSMSPISRMVI